MQLIPNRRRPRAVHSPTGPPPTTSTWVSCCSLAPSAAGQATRANIPGRLHGQHELPLPNRGSGWHRPSCAAIPVALPGCVGTVGQPEEPEVVHRPVLGVLGVNMDGLDSNCALLQGVRRTTEDRDELIAAAG